MSRERVNDRPTARGTGEHDARTSAPPGAPALVSDRPGLGDPTIMAAWLYYHEGMTQAEVAEVLKVSRPSVANMLARARESGIVQISVRPDFLATLTLSRQMRERFDLQEVIVVPVPTMADTIAVHRSLGKAGAAYLENTVQTNEILVTAWGATMLEVALALSHKPIPGVRIAQSLGGVSTADHFNPTRVASLMGEKLDARVYHLYVPCVVESREVRDILLRDRGIQSAFEVARSANRAIIGIGKVASDATIVRAGFLSVLQMEALSAKGAVGDMMGRFFDIDGEPVLSEINERMMALDFDELARIDSVIAVAGGHDKVDTILGAIRTGYIDVLIVDERTANAVMDLDRRSRDRGSEPQPQPS
jgi:DNA-binding transcriptional regulator LsrR (DeoR family)